MAEPLIFPIELTQPVRDVLSLMIYTVGPMAHRLRELGQEIPRHIEDEQAVVYHWLLTLALQHGSEWHDVAMAKLWPAAWKEQQQAKLHPTKAGDAVSNSN